MANTLASGASARKGLGVRVPRAAYLLNSLIHTIRKVSDEDRNVEAIDNVETARR